MAIKYSKDTPDWIKDYVQFSVKTLIPDWDICVVMVDDCEPDAPDNKGEIETKPEYLRADIRYEKELTDDVDGHERVVHEVCHAFLARLSETARNLISSKVVAKTAWKSYEHAEEEAVVRLSKLLVALRDKSMVNSKELCS
jgi:hypothetical protein